MKRSRFTKIVATLGPASATFEEIEALFLGGVDVFRLNFSHGTSQDHLARAQMIRYIGKKHSHPIGILQDLQGPKLRVGTFETPSINLEIGQVFALDLENSAGTQERVCLPHPEIFAALEPGMDLLMDDGRLRLKVIENNGQQLKARVLVGGVLSSHKGVNIPGVHVPISALTEKDRKDLSIGQEMKVDYIALSFVQRPEDVHELRSLLTYPAHIIAKLEKPAALTHLDEIIKASDAIMVARGDLGVEMALEKVPRLQRQIIRACRYQGKPVIVATQMLDSMIHSPIPTRAEASDVASAVYDGVDAVMLSAESASGQYPVESVIMMDKIIKTVEEDPYYRQHLETPNPRPRTHPTQAISGATRNVATAVDAKAIVTLTKGGRSTCDASCERPLTPLVALTPHAITAQQLSLVWGVHSYVVEGFSDTHDLLIKASQILYQDHNAREGNHVVVTSGANYLKTHESNVFQSGATRVLRIITLGEDV